MNVCANATFSVLFMGDQIFNHVEKQNGGFNATEYSS